MTIALDATNTSAGLSTGNLTFSHTCTGTSIDAIMFIAISVPTGANKPELWNVKYGTTAAKLVAQVGTDINKNKMMLYYIHNPPVGTANIDITTVLVNGSPLGEDFRAISTSLTGVSESFFIENSETAVGDGAVDGDPANSVTTEKANSWVLSWVTHDDQTTAMTVPSGHTQLNEGGVGSSVFEGRMSSAYKAVTSPGSEACNYTASATTGWWGHMAVSVREANPRATVTGINTLTIA